MKVIYKLLSVVSAIVLIACNKQINPNPVTVTEEIKYDLEDKLIPTVYYGKFSGRIQGDHAITFSRYCRISRRS